MNPQKRKRSIELITVNANFTVRNCRVKPCIGNGNYISIGRYSKVLACAPVHFMDCAIFSYFSSSKFHHMVEIYA